MISDAALQQRVKLRVEKPSTPLITFFYFVLKTWSYISGQRSLALPTELLIEFEVS